MEAHSLQPGDRIRFAPWPGRPDRTVDAVIVRQRQVRHFEGCRRTRTRFGMFDTIDDAGVTRSVIPSRCTLIEKASAGCSPADAPNPDALADAPAGVSVTRPIGPRAPGDPQRLDRRSVSP